MARSTRRHIARNSLRVGPRPAMPITLWRTVPWPTSVAKLMAGPAASTFLSHSPTGRLEPPQLPETVVVMPCRRKFAAVGLLTMPCECACTSTKPGQSARPAARIVLRAFGFAPPMDAMRSPLIPTDARYHGLPVPS